MLCGRPCRPLLIAVALVVVAVAGGTVALAAKPPSPGCQAALKKVAYAQTMVLRLQANLRNPNVTSVAGVVNPTRKRQIELQLARMKAQLRSALAEKANACATKAQTTSAGASITSFDGTYTGALSYQATSPDIGSLSGSTGITFTVSNGSLQGNFGPVPQYGTVSFSGSVNASGSATAGAAYGCSVSLSISPSGGFTGAITGCADQGGSASGSISGKRSG